MFYNEFLIFMFLSLNVYLNNMYMGVKKKNFVYVMKMIVIKCF